MIPFIDLQSQQALIKQKIEHRINQVLAHGQYILGPEVSELEQQLAAYTNVKHAITCASGTDALIMALYAFNVQPGDAIITTPYSFVAAAEAIALVGAIPLFCDINADDFNVDSHQLESIIADFYDKQTTTPIKIKQQLSTHSRIAGIIAVDLFGLPCDYLQLHTIAKQHDLFIIADAAQSFGASLNDKKVGSLAEITTTSFFPAKPLGCYGDGGALFTDNDTLAEILRSIRLHGQGKTRYEHIRLGKNSRLDTLQAAILLEKLAIFDQEFQQRQAIAKTYQAALQEMGLATQVINKHHHSVKQDSIRQHSIKKNPIRQTLSTQKIIKQSAWAQFSVQANNHDHRAQILSALDAHQIPYNIYYPIPLHLQTAYQYLGYQSGNMPVAEQLSQTLFSIPMHPYLDNVTINEIIKVINDVNDKYKYTLRE